ncbi:TPA: B12-binding domain-containing radical SAM protein [Thermoplasmata archaeon]|nr:B12-binding domain-containing radical SAM protein [Thermoplasmata archaeon]
MWGVVTTGAKIVLTADRTLMSSYNSSQFIGFAACFPKVLPRWLYTRLFCPPQHVSAEDRLAIPAGLRRIESALMGNGFSQDDVSVAYPTRIDRVVDGSTKVIGVSTSDPLGLGPASSTFSSLIRREPYTAHFFRELMSSRAVRSGRAKVIVGGPGVWQLSGERTRRRLNIDCVVEGEGDLVAPKLFEDAVAGRPLPPTVSGGAVPLEDIPIMRGPSVNGTVEISRGCGRGCEFCNPNMRTVRHIPVGRILEEVRMNLGHSRKITLHAEDVLRYGAKGLVPDREKVSSLFAEVAALTDRVGLSHIALSSALSEPRLVEDIAEIFDGASRGSRVYAQTGIETGSPELVSKHMRGKAKPYAPERWPEIVEESFKLLADNDWVVCGTLVMGMPGETQDDVRKTLELVRSLRPYKSLIVPLFFVPLADMKDGEFFRPEAMLPEHWMLFSECVDHDFRWAYTLMDELFRQNRTSSAKARMFRIAAWYMQRRLRPYLEIMREGKSPLKEVLELEESQASGMAQEKAEA